MNSTNSVALIDDHELLRNGLARIIDRFDGYRVSFEAGNGEEFIHQLSSHPNPDIILLDISMPVMDGFETAEWIKERLPESRILILSMSDNEAAVIRMLKLGARGYILKDSKPPVLKEAFDQIMADGYYSNELVSGRMVSLLKSGRTCELNVADISEREKEFLQHVCSDMTYKDIARVMNASPRTVDNYRDSLFLKFDIKTRVGLALFAIKNGFYVI